LHPILADLPPRRLQQRRDSSIGVPAQEDFIYRMCPKQVEVAANKRNTIDWILSRTSDGSKDTAPRELIHFLNALRDVQVKRLEVGEEGPAGEELFARQAFKDALPEVSKVRLEQTLYAEYPELKKSIEKLRGAKTLHTPETLALLWECSPEAAKTIAGKLAAIGFFEERGDHFSPQFWVPFLYRDALDMVQGSAT
jgi:hypothetical protein